MSMARALATGTVLNLAAVAAAPFGNGPALFALAAFTCTACIYVAARRHTRRYDRRSDPP